MSNRKTDAIQQALNFEGTDLEIRARLANASLVIEVVKAGACVYRVVLDHATDPLEHAWLAELFVRDEHVEMGDLAHQLDDYVGTLNTNQG